MNCHWNFQCKSSLHHFYALLFFVLKALRQWWLTRKAMQRKSVNYGKNLKQWSDEAFNTGKEVEVMKRLTLHCIASSLLLPSFAHKKQKLRKPLRHGATVEVSIAFYCCVLNLRSWEGVCSSFLHVDISINKIFKTRVFF
jgi:hypothetical protein